MQAQFDAALATLLLETTKPICLAVSGGSDSIALLHLAARSTLIPSAQLRAFTVDHRLRAEAAEEAAFVAGVCGALKIAHQTLQWPDPDASQARARQARHRLLARAAAEQGSRLLLTGHTQGDNAESFLIRARAGSGWYGLAGMGALSASPVWPEGEGIFVARPMLSMQRGDLRSWLAVSELSWRDDPSNENAKYERVRMRQLLSKVPDLSTRIERVQAKLTALREARGRAITVWLEAAAPAEGGLALPFSQHLAAETLAQALSFACMAVAGTDRPARSARSLTAAQRLQLTKNGSDRLTLTLGGAIIRRAGQKLVITRESNRQQCETPLNPVVRLRHICAGLTGAASA